MKKIIVLTALAGSFLTSCESRTYSDISEEVPNPTYVANVKPVIDAKCISCHNGVDEIPPLLNYEQVKDATQNGNVLCKIDGTCGDIMPPEEKMEQGILDMIHLWADQGFVEK